MKRDHSGIDRVGHRAPERSGNCAAVLKSGSRGFTLVEVMVATTIGLVVMAGMMTAFIWVLHSTEQCRQYAWAQTEAIKSSQRVVSYLRNAMAINQVDSGGNWIMVATPPTGVVARLAYVNPSGLAGAGLLTLVPNVADSHSATNVFAHGITKVMTLPSRNIFEVTGSNSVRIAYRITKPAASGAYPAEVDVGVRLRNY